MSNPYKECESCGMEKIPANVNLCAACETAEIISSQSQSEIARLREELESMTLERKDILDTVKACLVAAGGSEDEDELLRQLNKAGRKPSDFIRSQLGKLRQENERLRKDAERYEYIRCGRRTTAIYEYIRGERLLKLEHELDAAIDAAKESRE